jgi:hypothetical protein
MLCTIPPPQHSSSHLSPAQRAGLRYQARVEREVAKWAAALGWTLHAGLWLLDPLTSAPCSPDIVLESPGGCLLIIEVKLTQTDCSRQWAKYQRALMAEENGSDRQRPLDHSHRSPPPCIQICRRLTSPSTMSTLDDFHHGGVLLAFM